MAGEVTLFWSGYISHFQFILTIMLGTTTKKWWSLTNNATLLILALLFYST